MARPKKEIDETQFELDVRAGRLTWREIGAKHGVSHVAAMAMAEERGITRDLAAKIRAEAEAKLITGNLPKRISGKIERDLVENAALKVADIRMAHRVEAERLRGIAQKLITELDMTTDMKDMLADLGEMMRSEDGKSDRLNEVYQRVIALPNRVDCGKKIAEMLKSAIQIEREAYGLQPEQIEAELKQKEASKPLPPDEAYKRMLSNG